MVMPCSSKLFLAINTNTPLSVNAKLLKVRPDRSAKGSLLDNEFPALLETVIFCSGYPVMTQLFFKVSPTPMHGVTPAQFKRISSV